jgi:hypothetical protein
MHGDCLLNCDMLRSIAPKLYRQISGVWDGIAHADRT